MFLAVKSAVKSTYILRLHLTTTCIASSTFVRAQPHLNGWNDTTNLSRQHSLVHDVCVNAHLHDPLTNTRVCQVSKAHLSKVEERRITEEDLLFEDMEPVLSTSSLSGLEASRPVSSVRLSVHIKVTCLLESVSPYCLSCGDGTSKISCSMHVRQRKPRM